MKFAIIVGHNEEAQGAVRVTDGRTEFDWNSDLAAAIVDALPKGAGKVFFRRPVGSYRAEIDAVYAAADKWGGEATVELHFNANASPRAWGVKTLTSGTAGSKGLARAVHPAMLAHMPGPDRGIEARGIKDRGGRSLWAGKAPAVLVEPFFGSHAESCAKADEAAPDLAHAIAAALVLWRKGAR